MPGTEKESSKSSTEVSSANLVRGPGSTRRRGFRMGLDHETTSLTLHPGLLYGPGTSWTLLRWKRILCGCAGTRYAPLIDTDFGVSGTW